MSTGHTDNGAWFEVRDITSGNGVATSTARVAIHHHGSSVEIHAGRPAGRCTVPDAAGGHPFVQRGTTWRSSMFDLTRRQLMKLGAGVALTQAGWTASADGARVSQWNTSGADNQRFQLQPA